MAPKKRFVLASIAHPSTLDNQWAAISPSLHWLHVISLLVLARNNNFGIINPTELLSLSGK